jgi:hypothetical protein
MNLEHDCFFLNGAIELSQGSLLHVANYTSVCNGKVGVGNGGGGGVGSGDNVIQFKVDYNELANKDLGEDEEELLQAKE